MNSEQMFGLIGKLKSQHSLRFNRELTNEGLMATAKAMADGVDPSWLGGQLKSVAKNPASVQTMIECLEESMKPPVVAPKVEVAKPVEVKEVKDGGKAKVKAKPKAKGKFLKSK